MPQHPGFYVREKLIPKDVNVTQAAKMLGIGRPALSNFLNGKSDLSPEMAARLERTFGADAKELLDLQAEFDGQTAKLGHGAAAARAYVPEFLSIKARDIESWADRISARSELPVLLRKLVHSTGQNLRRVDFPGYDDAQRPGWDGFTGTDIATPWIPSGEAGWEFGCDKTPSTKAENDYAARIKSMAAKDRAKITFVFVTPRDWVGKTKWAEEKKAAGEWKDVRAFDASDLEQWLEQSIPAQAWLAERLSLPTKGFVSIEECWRRWSEVTRPPMSRALFAPSVSTYKGTFKAWLERAPDTPFTIAADSRDEALAFLACLFEDENITAKYPADLAIYFESAEALRQLSGTATPFIPIAGSIETERALATLHQNQHCIIVRPRNAVDSEPNVTLDMLDHQSFETALTEMGKEHLEIRQLARETGRSPTILRRRLSTFDAIRMPDWAKEVEIGTMLVPMMLAGAWQATSKADREIMSLLAGATYEDVERNLTRLLTFDDSPVWSAGQFRGVTSRLDCLFAVSKFITEQHLRDFLVAAEYVLSETDPALDLPEDKRPFAGLYGKVRDHSGALREGLCETLIILAVHGNPLLFDRTGFDIEGHISVLVRRLVTPLTPEKLLSQNNELEHYAEAAPNTFLEIIESDLKEPQPIIFSLLKSADSGIFGGGCPRSGLLWALECLAWNPQNLPRVILILGRLCEREIQDNWANKPENTLRSIFRSWMPQTAASLSDRISSLEMLTRKFPDVGWKVCIDQFDNRSRVGSYNYRPHWRSDAAGAGQVVTRGELREFVRKALDLAINWQHHNEKTLGDLVERMRELDDESQELVWQQIEKWAASNNDLQRQVLLRERIRKFALTRRASVKGLPTATRDRATEIYENLAPADPVLRHLWLFEKVWVEDSAFELTGEDMDYRRREERIHAERLEAVRDIWSKRGFTGISELISLCQPTHIIGRCMCAVLTEAPDHIEFVMDCMALEEKLEPSANECIHGLLMALEEKMRSTVVSGVLKKTRDAASKARLLRCAPFNQTTWSIVEKCGDEVRTLYWQKIRPYWHGPTPEELNELIDRLLEFGRPAAAFHIAHLEWKDVETSRLKRLLHAVAVGGNQELDDRYQFTSYEVVEALKSLNRRLNTTNDDAAIEEMAQLEFLYIGALDHTDYGIPNLSRVIGKSPELFAQIIAFAFKRADGGEDPEELRLNDPEQIDNRARAAYELLQNLKVTPGTNGTDGKISTSALYEWLVKAREACAAYDREKIGDQLIGQLLSRSPSDDEDIWPCEEVCEALERIASTEISKGLHVGLYNARGAHWRGEGGNQEREIANRYRKWSERRRLEYPYVGAFLEEMARSYEQEAKREDTEARVRRRLR